MTFLNKASVRILNSLKYFRFYNEMGGGNSKTTVNYLISLIDRVHKIYEDTIWRDSTNGQGFSGNFLLQIYSQKEKFGKKLGSSSSSIPKIVRSFNGDDADTRLD